MACENKGYFTHVTTLAEVKEQVLKYIPVMARPLVLLREKHPIRWTGVYADIEVFEDVTAKGPTINFNFYQDPKTSRWLWDIRERSRQKKRTENYRSIIAMQQSASFGGGGEGDAGPNIQVMEDMTRLTDKQQMANFLTWGKWDLDDSAIEKLVKDEERKERVSCFCNLGLMKFLNNENYLGEINCL